MYKYHYSRVLSVQPICDKATARWTKSGAPSTGEDSLKYASVRPKRITRLSQQSPSSRLPRENARVRPKIKYVKSNGALKYSRRNLLRKQDTAGTSGLGGVGLTKSDRRFNWNRSNARALPVARVSGVTVRCRAHSRSRLQCVSRGFCALLG